MANRLPARLNALRRALSTSAIQRSSLSVLPSAIDPTSTEFLQRKEDMATLERELATALGVVKRGGGDRAIAKVRAAGNGKLLVRERSVSRYEQCSTVLTSSTMIAVELRSSWIRFRHFSNYPLSRVTKCTRALCLPLVSSPVLDESLGQSQLHSTVVTARCRNAESRLFTFLCCRIECMIVANDVRHLAGRENAR